MNKYLLNLYKQFCDARGMICNPFEFNNRIDDFIEWIAHNRKLAGKYREYLISLGYINGKTISEIGKGKYDSLRLVDSTFISPYADALGFKISEFFMIGNYPLLKVEQRIFLPNTDILLTHNPYDEMMIYNWIKIHNYCIKDISIGVYGNIHDSNFEEKIELIEHLSKLMNNDHSLDYETDKDEYFCSINSRRIVKNKVLVK